MLGSCSDNRSLTSHRLFRGLDKFMKTDLSLVLIILRSAATENVRIRPRVDIFCGDGGYMSSSEV